MLAREAVHQITGQRTHHQQSHSVGRECQTCIFFRQSQLFNQIDWHCRHQQIECKVHPEIGQTTLHKIPAPKFIFHYANSLSSSQRRVFSSISSINFVIRSDLARSSSVLKVPLLKATSISAFSASS